MSPVFDSGGWFEIPGERLREPTGDITELRGFVNDELPYLWCLLWEGYQRYLDTRWLGEHPHRFDQGGTKWSVGCDGLGERILAATALVGPVRWHDVPMSSLLHGWFEWANHKIGIAGPDLPGELDLAACRKALRCQHIQGGSGG